MSYREDAKVGTISSRKKKRIKVDIFRFKKSGTKRVFFAPKVKGKRLSKTLFARKYDAEKLAFKYIEFAESK